MSPVPVSSMPPRKSFAQVAAAAHVPVVPKEKQTSPNPPQPTIAQNGPANPPVSSTVTSPVSAASDQPVIASRVLKRESSDTKKPNGITVKPQISDLGPVPSPSVESLTRRDNSDTKSVASRTTLTLDEKESLRPDDSASVQAAAVEDDRTSPGGSRLGTASSEARAFSDQLHEIERTAEPPRATVQRGLPHIVFPLPRQQNGPVLYAGSSAPAPYQPSSLIDPNQFRPPHPGVALPPDDKLMEALESPKDRLFVLKVEQDIIVFVKDSKEQVLILPQTNSFYRMLSHKLADYYCLDHAVDDSMQSVRISRTAHCRLPTSLISMATGADGPTPPPSAPTRKIMRRNEGNSSGFNTENPSKTTSEAGMMSGSEEGNTPAKDKSQLTREERESRYNEARARIFSDWKGDAVAEDANGNGNGNEIEPSRASSPSKGKKSKKKKPKDDGFEPRSTFNALPNQPYVSNQMSSQVQQQITNMAMFNAFQGLNVSGPFPASPGQMPVPGSGGHEQSVPQSYVQPGQWFPPSQQYPAGYPLSPYGQSTPMMYQPNAEAAHGNMYNSQSIGGSQTTPKPGNVAPAGYAQMYPQPNGQSGWNQMAYQTSYGQQAPPFHDPNSMPQSQMYYGFPPSPMPAMQPQGVAFYDPNAWNAYQNQQFNPMSQAFVPSFGHGQAVAGRFAPGTGMQRQPSNTSHVSGFGSPKARSGPQSPRARDNVSAPKTSASGGQQSTISKWANTTSLPSKPPAPTKADKPSVPANPLVSSNR